MFAAFAFPFAASSLNIALPYIGDDFQVPAASLTWVMSAMMLTNISLNVPIGRFADHWGKRRIFNIGILIFSAAALLAAFAPNFWVLIIMRVFQGIGGAMFTSTNLAILIDAFPAKQRGRVFGLSVMTTYIGLSTGPIIGGLIIHYLSWRTIFILTSMVAMVVSLVALISSSKLPKASEVPLKSATANPVSNMLYISAMFLFMYGFMTLGQQIYSYFALAAGIILLVIFGWYELRTMKPIIEVRLFKGNLNFVFSNLSAMFNYTTIGAIGYILTIYFVIIRGFQPDIAGFILIVQPATMAIISPIAGRLSDKRSPFIISSVGMAICAASMLIFLLLHEDSPLILVILNLILSGVGFGVFSSPNTTAVMSCISPRDSSVANSILSTMRMSGQLFSMAIITIIMYFTLGNELVSEAETASLMTTIHSAYIVFSILCIVGVLLSLGRKKKKQPCDCPT